MSKLHIIWLDADRDFCDGLSRAIYRQDELPLVIEFFHERECLIKRLMDKEPFHAIVLEESEPVEGFDLSSDCKVFYIDHEPTGRQGYIFKYQSISQLMKDLLSKLEIKKEKKSAAREIIKSIAVYDLYGRCGADQIARKIVKRLNGLLISWPAYASSDDVDSYMMDDLLFDIKSKREHIGMHTQLMATCVDGYHEIPPGTSYFDYREMEYEDMSWFLNQLKEEKVFPSVVFSIGESVMGDAEIFRLFDKIIIPVPSNEDHKKVHAYTRCLQKLNLSSIEKRIMTLSVSWDGKEVLYGEDELMSAISE